jgi:hypothetical protein
MRLQLLRVGLGLLGRAHHRPQPPHVAQDAGHRAVVADPHLHPGQDQRAGDVGLHVGEADREVGFQVQDAVDLGAGERRHARLLLPALGGRTVKPEMPTMRCCSPRA